jgi:hypothetical protein
MKPTLNIYDASQTRDISKLAPAKGSTMSADIEFDAWQRNHFASIMVHMRAAGNNDPVLSGMIQSAIKGAWLAARATPQAPTPAAVEGQADPVGTFLRVKDAFGEVYLHMRGEHEYADAIDLYAAPLPRQAAVQTQDAKEIAISVAHEVLHHIDSMYPEMWKPVAKLARTSIRNLIVGQSQRFVAKINEGNAIEAARYRYIEDHASTDGGGSGFMIRCFVPVDHEDMGCGLDEAIATMATATHAAPTVKASQ